MKILILNEKHETRYIAIREEPAGVEYVMSKIINQRVAAGYWYHDLDQAECILLDKSLDGDEKSIRKFFKLRQDAEYEGWEIVDLEEV